MLVGKGLLDNQRRCWHDDGMLDQPKTVQLTFLTFLSSALANLYNISSLPHRCLCRPLSLLSSLPPFLVVIVMFAQHPLYSMSEKRRTSKKALAVWAFCGFILVFSFWSLFVGDWRKQGLPTDDTKTPESIGPLWKGWDGLRNVFVL